MSGGTVTSFGATSKLTTGVHAFGGVSGDSGNATINNTFTRMMPVLMEAENEINTLMSELNSSEAGTLDQSRLLYAQMASTRWQMAYQLGSNILMSIASGLKNTVQNVGR
jgi:hypothetical protein